MNYDIYVVKVVLVIAIVLLVFQFYLFIPLWGYKIANIETVAKITTLSQDKLAYSYFDRVKKIEITRTRKIIKRDYDKLILCKNLRIKYSEFMADYVVVLDIEKEPGIVFSFLAILVVLVSIKRHIFALRGRMTVKELYGLRELNDQK